MMSPSPPPPATAAIVAVATTKTVAVRIPTKISGNASGSSTRVDDLPPGHSHSPGGLDGVGLDAVDRDVGVGEDRRDREDDQRDRDAPEPDADEHEADRDQREARQRASEVRDVHREKRAAVQMAEPDAERQGDRDRDRDRCAREEQVLPCLLEDQVPLVDDELERVAEDRQARDHDALRARFHGVSARSASTSSASATSARPTASAPATRISVLNASRSATKIG